VTDVKQIEAAVGEYDRPPRVAILPDRL